MTTTTMMMVRTTTEEMHDDGEPERERARLQYYSGAELAKGFSQG